MLLHERISRVEFICLEDSFSLRSLLTCKHAEVNPEVGLLLTHQKLVDQVHLLIIVVISAIQLVQDVVALGRVKHQGALERAKVISDLRQEFLRVVSCLVEQFDVLSLFA